MRTRTHRFIAAGAAAVLLVAFALLAAAVTTGLTLNFDLSLLAAVHSATATSVPIGPAWLAEAVRDVTALGSVSVLTVLTVACAIWFLLHRDAPSAWHLTLAVAAGALLNALLKLAFDRGRPEIVSSARVFTASFPSGHSAASTIFYLTLASLLAARTSDRRLKALYFAAGAVITVMVGLSRIYLGVHYPTDVLGGWCIGGAWVLISLVVASRIRERSAPA